MNIYAVASSGVVYLDNKSDNIIPGTIIWYHCQTLTNLLKLNKSDLF